jgi:hypothetical protein
VVDLYFQEGRCLAGSGQSQSKDWQAGLDDYAPHPQGSLGALKASVWLQVLTNDYWSTVNVTYEKEESPF